MVRIAPQEDAFDRMAAVDPITFFSFVAAMAMHQFADIVKMISEAVLLDEKLAVGQLDLIPDIFMPLPAVRVHPDLLILSIQQVAKQ